MTEGYYFPMDDLDSFNLLYIPEHLVAWENVKGGLYPSYDLVKVRQLGERLESLLNDENVFCKIDIPDFLLKEFNDFCFDGNLRGIDEKIRRILELSKDIFEYKRIERWNNIHHQKKVQHKKKDDYTLHFNPLDKDGYDGWL